MPCLDKTNDLVQQPRLCDHERPNDNERVGVARSFETLRAVTISYRRWPRAPLRLPLRPPSPPAATRGCRISLPRASKAPCHILRRIKRLSIVCPGDGGGGGGQYAVVDSSGDERGGSVRTAVIATRLAIVAAKHAAMAMATMATVKT